MIKIIITFTLMTLPAFGLSVAPKEKNSATVQQRKVAQASKDDADARQIKKIKETFFMRTFER